MSSNYWVEWRYSYGNPLKNIKYDWKRLEIYSNILIATNELLFKSLENILKIKFDGHYKLNLDDRI